MNQLQQPSVPLRIRALRAAVILGCISLVLSVVWAGSRQHATPVPNAEPEEQSHPATQVIVDVPEVEPEGPVEPEAKTVARPAPSDLKLKVLIAEVDRTAALGARIGSLLPQETMRLDTPHVERALDHLKHSKCAATLKVLTLAFRDKQTADLDVDGIVATPGSEKIAYGVQITLTPTLLDGKRTRIDVAAKVHAREGATAQKSFVIWNAHGFSVSGTVSDGQTLAIAGLLSLTSRNHQTPRALPDYRDADREVVLHITPEFER